MKKGKLIVIDGTDGSGKSTQIDLLSKKLKSEGFKVKSIHFPHYENFMGGFIGHCLTEQYYNFINVHPKIVSVLYAADRWESSKEINKYLDKGYMVVLDRYVSANQIHQGGKIKNVAKRVAFLKWLDEMEYKVFKIPRPDLTVYLSLPIHFVEMLIEERNKKAARAYAGNKKDVHEVDRNFKENSIKSALWLAKTQKNWVKIECIKNGKLDTRENIHAKVYEKVKKVLK
ncbi:MAG: deoxynucleoside kinase [Candidatus Pacebacteria bacterium]|nr:deoxynucleoside kinase [Candidatus Paceibacterota bacterium]